MASRVVRGNVGFNITSLLPSMQVILADFTPLSGRSVGRFTHQASDAGSAFSPPEVVPASIIVHSCYCITCVSIVLLLWQGNAGRSCSFSFPRLSRQRAVFTPSCCEWRAFPACQGRNSPTHKFLATPLCLGRFTEDVVTPRARPRSRRARELFLLRIFFPLRPSPPRELLSLETFIYSGPFPPRSSFSPFSPSPRSLYPPAPSAPRLLHNALTQRSALLCLPPPPPSSPRLKRACTIAPQHKVLLEDMFASSQDELRLVENVHNCVY